MRVSEYFELGLSQSSLDFLDVDVERDTNLFIDPSALRLFETEWGGRCVSLIQDYFRRVLEAVRDGDEQLALRILEGLREPNETHLGHSSGRSRGTALGPGIALSVYKSLAESEAVRSGLLQDLEETVLMVGGVSHDRVSDIVTNIVREPLVEYTQAVARWYNIPLTEGVACGSVWDPVELDWHQRYFELPVTDNGVLLLVPKAIVRKRAEYRIDEYYNKYVLEHIQRLELDNPNSALVKLLKDGTPRVYKKTLKEHLGTGKIAAVEQTRAYPAILDEFRESKRAQASGAMESDEIAAALGIVDGDLGDIVNRLDQIPTGNENATNFHRTVKDILTTVAYPYLAYPVIELEIHEGRKRIDIAFSNVAKSGFFSWIAQHFSAAHIFVECKNSGRDVANPALDQLAGRFSRTRGQVGLLVCRSFDDKDLFLERCKDTANDDRGFIIPLDDGDLKAIIRDEEQAPGAFRLLKERFELLLH